MMISLVDYFIKFQSIQPLRLATMAGCEMHSLKLDFSWRKADFLRTGLFMIKTDKKQYCFKLVSINLFIETRLDLWYNFVL